MKSVKKRKTVLWVLCAVFSVIAVLFALAAGSGKLSLPVAKKDHFEMPDSGTAFAQKLHVNGKELVNEDGEAVILRGVMAPELNKLDQEKKFRRSFFDEVFDFGGNVIRIPVHPYAWEQDEYYLWRYLDPVVQWAVENDFYVILDMHCIGNIGTGDGEQMPSGNVKKFAEDFWTLTANYFRDVPNVLFEIYNEPTLINAKTWADNAAKLVDIIRGADCKQVIIVSSRDYTYDLSYWAEHPLDDSNVMYSAHLFPNRNSAADLSKYADKLPVIVTEWGYIAAGEPVSQSYLIGTKENYGVPMLEAMEEKGVSWVACWYDDGWEPPMLKKDGQGLTEWGELVKDALR